MLFAFIWNTVFCISSGNFKSIVFCIDQDVSRSHAERVPRDMSAVVPQSRRKWLNVVLDLNGVLCETVAKSSLEGKVKFHSIRDNVYSWKQLTVVGNKAVYARPGVQEFLNVVTGVAKHVIVWSSMLHKNAQPVCVYLFQNTTPPFDVLGQEKCRTVQKSIGQFLVQGGNPFKALYLKVLDEQLFSSPLHGAAFTKDDTILIDDSPFKSVLNENGNGVFS